MAERPRDLECAGHRPAAGDGASKDCAGETVVYLGFGSNLGDRARNYEAAIHLLGAQPGITVIRFSSLREYPPMGPVQPDYLNGVIEIRTRLSPKGLLEAIHGIEARLGRRRETRWGPRPADLDILFYGDVTLENGELTIPHPGIAERRFVLEPLAELCPDLIDPRTGRSVRDLLASL